MFNMRDKNARKYP